MMTQPIQTITQLIQITNIVISPQNTTTTAMLNTTIQFQNTITVPNIFNLTSQSMKIITEAIAEGSNPQNNVTSNMNTEGEHFSHFGTIRANLFRRFGAFGENNGFNLPLRGNAKGLDPNVTVLVNALTGANLGINYVKRESNHVKTTEFGRIEAEDPNE